MRKAGIPNSQRPTKVINTKAGRQFQYDVGGKTKLVTKQTIDRVKGHGPHFEAGDAKIPLRTDGLGRLRVVNEKVKINY